jgi:hypothetical protein
MDSRFSNHTADLTKAGITTSALKLQDTTAKRFIDYLTMGVS